MKTLVTFGILLSLSAVFQGCGNSSKQTRSSKKVFVDFLTQNPGNLDPCFGTDVDEARIQAKLLNGLVRYDHTLKIVPDLAESFQISEDGLTYTFKLRSGIKFHSGHPLSSKDVVFTLNRLMNPENASPRAWVLENVAKISSATDLSVEITLKKPFAQFISLLAMPAGYILCAKKPFIEISGKKVPNGTGPYKVAQWKEDLSLELASNEHYFAGKIKVDGYRFRVLSQTGVQESSFITSNLDRLELRDVNFKKFTEDSRYNRNIKKVAALNVYYIGFNCQKPPYNDPRVRQAFNYAIDRKLLLKTYKNSQGVLAAGSIPPGLPGRDPKLAPYPYNPEKARALLKETDLDLPLKATIWMKPNQENLDIVQGIQSQLKKAGIDLKIKKIDWAMLKEAINRGEPDMYYLSWYADYPDGENFLAPLFHSKNWGSGGNRARYSSAEIDALIDSSHREFNDQKRYALYQKINRKVFEDAPWVYLWHESKSVITSRRIRGYFMSTIPNVFKGVELEIQEK